MAPRRMVASFYDREKSVSAYADSSGSWGEEESKSASWLERGVFGRRVRKAIPSIRQRHYCS